MSYILFFIIPVMGFVTFPSSVAQTQVTIPLGASDPSTPFSLSPSVLDIQINDTVQWKNNDTAVHTVTTGSSHLGFDGRVDSGVISPGNTFSYKFEKIGVYGYYCLFHPWMTGIVNVEAGVTQAQSVVEISLSTDKPSYHTGDTILISGKVSKLIPNEQVTVWITDTQGKGILINHVEPEMDNSFSNNVIALGGLWIPGNVYKIFTQYGSRSSIATTTIQFEPKNSTEVTEQDKTIQDSNSTGISPLTVVSYMSSPKKLNADSNNFVTVQTEHKIYEPNEQVKIYGSIWQGMFQQVGGSAYLTTVPATSSNGNYMAQLIHIEVKAINGTMVSNKETQVNSTGDYVTSVKLPSDVRGIYTVMSSIETKPGLQKTLDSSSLKKLTSSIDFLVPYPVDFPISTSLGNFIVEITSNSALDNFEFKSEDNKISFDVQNPSGAYGVSSISIPNKLLYGNLQVLVDGLVQPYNSDNVIMTSNNSETVLELNYENGFHRVEIVSDQAKKVTGEISTIPEFNSTVFAVFAISVISIMIFSTKVKYCYP